MFTPRLQVKDYNIERDHCKIHLKVGIDLDKPDFGEGVVVIPTVELGRVVGNAVVLLAVVLSGLVVGNAVVILAVVLSGLVVGNAVVILVVLLSGIAVVG